MSRIQTKRILRKSTNKTSNNRGQSLWVTIEVHYHYVRENVIGEDVDLKYIKIEDQIADVLSKALPKDRFFKFRKKLGLCDQYKYVLEGVY